MFTFKDIAVPLIGGSEQSQLNFHKELNKMEKSAFDEDKISAVHDLQGKELHNGWHVIKKVEPKPGATGGNFSICYVVERDGQKGFLKAINILSFLRDKAPGLTEAMAELLNTFNYEKEILTRCKNRNFSKVSRLLEASYDNFPGYLIANVYYMIFEKADGDVRAHLNFSGLVDNAWKLRSLHNIAVGLKQLHSIDVSHQDLKPSNVFIFDQVTSKIGDLGRSLCENLESPHSNLHFAGDNRYAPPEIFHKYLLPEWKNRVYAIDIYLLGSMTCFYFTNLSMTALLSQKINSEINILSLDFENALPYWMNAFDKVIDEFEEHVEHIHKKELLIEAMRMLCNPDPRKRGHFKNIRERGSNYNLERFVGIFNLLASTAEYQLTN